MSIHCPFCNSERVRACNIARKVGGAAGAAGGAATGAANAVVGARSGAAIGAVAGPVGIALGGLEGAILGGLAGGAVGSLAGARLGEARRSMPGCSTTSNARPAAMCFPPPTTDALCCDAACPAPLPVLTTSAF